jgi:hypothetical protein
MNQFDIEQIAYRSGLIGMETSESRKAAFWANFEMNLRLEMEQEKEDTFPKTIHWNLWED